MAGAGGAELYPEPRPLVEPRSREGRDGAAADLPAADPDPYAVGQCQMALRDLAREPAVAAPRGRDAARRGHRRPPEDRHAHRSLRRQGVGDRIGAPGRGRVLASPGPLAAARRRRRRAVVDGARRSEPPRRGQVAHAAGPRAAAVHERRSRFIAHLVERGRRAPEPHVPGPARPGQRPALLAPEGDRDAPGAGRPLRRRLRRHRQIVRGLPRMAGAGPAGARPRQPETPALAAARLQARPFGLSTGQRLTTPPGIARGPAVRRDGGARYWMSWSAWSSSVLGMVSLRILALLRLMTSSNFVGSSIGNSPGLAPLRTLST